MHFLGSSNAFAKPGRDNVLAGSLTSPGVPRANGAVLAEQGQAHM